MVRCQRFEDCEDYYCKKEHDLEVRKELCEDGVECKEKRCPIFYLHPSENTQQKLYFSKEKPLVKAFVTWVCQTQNTLSLNTQIKSHRGLNCEVHLSGNPSEVEQIANYLEQNIPNIRSFIIPQKFENERILKQSPNSKFFVDKQPHKNNELKVFVFTEEEEDAEKLLPELKKLTRVKKEIKMPLLIRYVSVKQRKMNSQLQLEYYCKKFSKEIIFHRNEFQLEGFPDEIEELQRWLDIKLENLMKDQRRYKVCNITLKQALFLSENSKLLRSIGEETGALISLPRLNKIHPKCCFTRTKGHGISIDVIEGNCVFECTADFYLSTKEPNDKKYKKKTVVAKQNLSAEDVKRKLEETFDMSSLQKAATIAVPLFGDGSYDYFVPLYDTSYFRMLSGNCNIHRIIFVGDRAVCDKFIEFLQSEKNEESDVESPSAVAEYLATKQNSEILETSSVNFVIQYLDFMGECGAEKKLRALLDTME